MSRGYVYPARPVSPSTGSHWNLIKTDNRNFRVVSTLGNDGETITKFVTITPYDLRMGKQRVSFDVTVNSGDISNLKLRLSHRDPQTNLQPIAGSNIFDVDISDDGIPDVPSIYFAFHEAGVYDVTISNLEVTHEHSTLTVDRTAPVITSDRKGQSRPLLSKVVGGATAAYSLRDLNDKSHTSKVVRVRRESDNNERDFNAKEVSNGTLQNWTNAQVTPPLDVRELEADGRTGDFLIPKAAYSLRSLGARQATLAATGDTVARADGKFVIQARRTSDDALKSFTADEVTDGTLTAWVTEYVANLVGNARYFNGTSTSVEVDRPATDSFSISGSFLSINNGGYGILSFGDNINNRFYVGAASSGRIQIFNVNAGSLVFDQTVLTDYADGTIHNFSFVTGVSGTILTIDGSEIINISTQIRTGNYATSKMRFGSRFTTAYASYIQGTLYDITIDSTNAYTGLGTSVTAWEDTIGSNNGTEVNGATYTGQGFDGMVSKWYDQSVNQAGNVRIR